MAEDKVEDKKADADGGEKLDKVLAHLDSVMSACDALSSRMDAYEEEKKAKTDAEAAEEEAKKTDEGEEAELDKPEPVAADKAKKDAEEEEAMMADKAKKDAEDEAAEKAKADSEEIRKRIADVESRLPRQMTDAEFASMADAQARADSVFSMFGKRAPRPLDGENETRYRRRLATMLKSHSPDWKDVNLNTDLGVAAFEVAERRIYADAETAALHPTDIEGDDLREITTTDPSTGLRMTRFAGKHTFINGMKRPARRVIGIGVPRH